MYKILTLNNISESGTNELPTENYEILSKCENPDAILLRSYNMHDYELPKSLVAVGRAGAGTNNIPVDKCSDQGVVVFNTPGANANAVKELVVAGLLISSRKVVDGINWVNTLKGTKDVAKAVESGKATYVGPELSGKKLGVIGLGAIGVMVANVAKSLGMKVYGYDPFISVDSAWGLSRSIEKAVSIDAILADCDYITLHIPLTGETKNLFNEKSFEIVKKGARLLNFSRAELVDHAALIKAMENDILSAYVTDFPTDDIVGVKNVITIPHLGASTPESEDNCAYMAANEIKDFLEFGTIKNSVNMPDCSMPCSSNQRIFVINKNIPNMVSALTNVLAKNKINIENMLSKSRGGWACTIVDVDKIENEAILEEIKAIEGVASVRLIKF